MESDARTHRWTKLVVKSLSRLKIAISITKLPLIQYIISKYTSMYNSFLHSSNVFDSLYLKLVSRVTFALHLDTLEFVQNLYLCG